MSTTNLHSFQPEPVTLEGSVVRLIPLSVGHVPELWDIAKDSLEDTFRWIHFPMQTQEYFHLAVEKALAEQAAGICVPFATMERSSGRLVGSTRFLSIDRSHRRVEIGGTWIAPGWQRTAVNTEAKYLMLRHAFENWRCIRVELKTDALNQRSRNAILRIGAKEEGTLRQHMVTHSGRLRSSIYFSIVDFEWPAVKAMLESKLKAAGIKA